MEYAVALTFFEKLTMVNFPMMIRAYQNDHILAGAHNHSEFISMDEAENSAVKVVSGRYKSSTLGEIHVPHMVGTGVKSNVETIL